ncbi:MAG: crotonase/enoyl-CoA hydratase family protein [Acidimicrobiia bacterium]
MSDAVTLALDHDVAVITLDDGKANALSFAVLDGLNDALATAEESAKAVVLVGRDGKFSAGFDLAVMSGPIDDARRLLATGAMLGLRIYMFPIPVVLGVTGHALAMGGILTTTADYRVGAEGSYKLGLNEVAIGMPVPTFGVELCRDRLSPAWFTRCVQSATLCTPAEAVEAGFLDEVVALEAVPGRAIEVAAHLAETVHPGPFQMTRQTIRGALAERLRVGLDADMALFDVST